MPKPDEPTPLGPRRGQMTIGRMLLIMALLSVAAAVYGGVVRSGFRKDLLLIFGLAAPVGIMIALSLWVEWKRRRR